MTQTIVVLAEEALQDADVRNLVAVQGEEGAQFLFLLQRGRGTTLLQDLLRHLKVFESTHARDDPSAQHAQPGAASDDKTLESSLQLARGHGLSMTGQLVAGDAVARLVEAAADADQAIVITRPHALADTFHTDWANKAQAKLGIPVLHLYSGSGFIGDS